MTRECMLPLFFSLAVLSSNSYMQTCTAFNLLSPVPERTSSSPSSSSVLFDDNYRPFSSGSTALKSNINDNRDDAMYNRRSLLRHILLLSGTTTAAGMASIATSPPPAYAATEEDPIPLNMKTFDDPKGLFSIRVPQRFYVLRRSAKGDLPDAKTGNGRRGSSIFTAGDMAKAEVVAVERFPTKVLLEEEGITVDPSSADSLSTFPKIGSPVVVAELLNQRRERDRAGNGSKAKLVKESVRVSEDGKTLEFELRTNIDVQKPELLFEQTGLKELIRITLAKAELRSAVGGGPDENPQMMIVYASALQQDYMGVDGNEMRDSVRSFVMKE